MNFLKTTCLISLVTLFAGTGAGCSSFQSKPFPDGPGNDWEKSEKYSSDDEDSNMETESSFVRQTNSHFCMIQKGKKKGFVETDVLFSLIYIPEDNVIKNYAILNQRKLYLSFKLNPDAEFSSIEEFDSFFKELPNEPNKHPKVKGYSQKSDNLKNTFTQSECWNNTDTIADSEIRTKIENAF